MHVDQHFEPAIPSVILTLGAKFNFIFYCLIYLAVYNEHADMSTTERLSWLSCDWLGMSCSTHIVMTAIRMSFDPQAVLDLCKADGF